MTGMVDESNAAEILSLMTSLGGRSVRIGAGDVSVLCAYTYCKNRLGHSPVVRCSLHPWSLCLCSV
jgi:hypothetical protein